MSDHITKIIRDAIQARCAEIADEEAKAAAARVESRIKELVPQIAVALCKRYSMEMLGERKHAMVKRDGFDVPLIGIPPDAVQEICDFCGLPIQITDTEFVDGKIVCLSCRNTGATNSS